MKFVQKGKILKSNYFFLAIGFFMFYYMYHNFADAKE